MLAVKGMNIYMVRQLVKKNADIAAVDSEGKSGSMANVFTSCVLCLCLFIRRK